MSNIIPCNTLAELNEATLGAGKKLVVMSFVAGWNLPSMKMLKELDKLSKQETDITFLRVNIAINKKAARLFQIYISLPTFVFIKEDHMLEKVSNAMVQSYHQQAQIKNKTSRFEIKIFSP